MDRRLLLALVSIFGCAQGSLEGPGFGLPVTATQPAQSDTGDDDDDETGSSSGEGSGSVSASGGVTSAADAGSSSGDPVSAGPESSDDGVTVDPSAEESSSGVDPTDASATDPTDASDDGDPPPPPPPDAGPWESCEAADCEAGNDCITVTGLDANDAYCSPQCQTDLDCPYPDTGDATPFCALVADDAVDPTNCALVCEYDGLDYGTCPNGMECAGIPGQDPTISLCMW